MMIFQSPPLAYFKIRKTVDEIYGYIELEIQNVFCILQNSLVHRNLSLINTIENNFEMFQDRYDFHIL